MNVTSTSYGKDMKRALAEFGRHAFQDKCFEMLREIIPHLINARELGDVDKIGVDLYTLNIENGQFAIVFQCKGNEVPDFNKDHFVDCLKSIRSFQKSDKKTESYFLVVKRGSLSITEEICNKKEGSFSLRHAFNFGIYNNSSEDI